MFVPEQSATELTVAEVLKATMAAYDAAAANEEVFIVFLDQNRDVQVVAFICEDEDGEYDPAEELDACLTEITEKLDEGCHPVCVINGISDKQGEIEFVSDIVPLQHDPSLDDQAVMWSLTEVEDERVATA